MLTASYSIPTAGVPRGHPYYTKPRLNRQVVCMYLGQPSCSSRRASCQSISPFPTHLCVCLFFSLAEIPRGEDCRHVEIRPTDTSIARDCLGQPIPGRYPYAFPHPARGANMSSRCSSRFAFSRATVTPQSNSTSTRESHEARSTGKVETTTASSLPFDGSQLRLYLPICPCRAFRMYVAYPCPLAIQQLEVVANAPRQHTVLSPLHQRAILRPQGHDKHSRGIVGSCVIALARKFYRNLTARTTALPAWDSPCLMAHSRRVNAKIPLAYFLHPYLSQVLGHHYLAV